MEVKEVLFMSTGEGENSYLQNSGLTQKVAVKSKPILERAVESLFTENSSLPFQVLNAADLGCSSGPNSFSVMSTVIQSVENKCRELKCKTIPEFQFYLNDLPGNDFNTLFKGLTSFVSEKHKNVSCFVMGAPGSFHGRLFPRNTMHLVHSSYGVHWLSKVPIDLPINKGKIYISKTSPPAVREAYLAQFQQDFSLFLRSRAQEMVPNVGRVVLILHGRLSADPTSKDSYTPWELFSDAISHLVSKVEETLSQFTFELDRDFNKGCLRVSIVLKKEFQGEFVQVDSGDFYVPNFDFEDLTVTISKHRGSSLQFNCSYTPDEISILDITVVDGDQYLEIDLDVDENVDENENLKKAFQKYLEVRGIKHSTIKFIFKCIKNNYIKLIVLKKIKNFILSSAKRDAARNKQPDKTIARQTEKKATTEGKQQVDQTKNNVEKPQSEFTFKIENSAWTHGVVLTREYQGELDVQVVGYIKSFTTGKDRTHLRVTISDGKSYLKFGCFGTSNAISIQSIGILNSKYSEDYCPYDNDGKEVEFDNMNENLKKAFFEYLEISGIKPSIVDFMIKCYKYKKGKNNVDGVEED